MKKLLLISLALTPFTFLHADEYSTESSLYKIQVAFLEAGISLNQCVAIKDKMQFDLKACDLIASQYNSFGSRAKKLVESVPKNFKDKTDEYYISKISDLIKAFPDTTDKEVLDAMMSKKECKQNSEQLI